MVNGAASTAYERIKCQQSFGQVINDEDIGVGFGGHVMGPAATAVVECGAKAIQNQAGADVWQRWAWCKHPLRRGTAPRSGQDFALRYQYLKIAKQTARGEIDKHHACGFTLGRGAAFAVPGLFGAQKAWPRWQNSAGFMPLRCQTHGVMLRGPKDVR